MFIQLHHAHVQPSLHHIHFVFCRVQTLSSSGGCLIDVYPALRRWSYSQPQGTSFSSGSRFSPSYFRVVGRSHEFAFTETHDLSVTINVIGVELISLDVGPRMAYDVAYHGFAAGHATPGLHVVGSGLLRFFFFDFFSFF